jgi:hypothetical protein
VLACGASCDRALMIRYDNGAGGADAAAADGLGLGISTAVIGVSAGGGGTDFASNVATDELAGSVADALVLASMRRQTGATEATGVAILTRRLESSTADALDDGVLI